ncbi:unnamed protein product [Acanthosepion pharaonis]|uniref:Uncharacterized protein n=1 Tax=Acanthosepion pharaonis TaxID=158019 RepID=A0A812EUE5_ACAPH|nr:unnamed protein product [Sepia pharaonis]
MSLFLISPITASVASAIWSSTTLCVTAATSGGATPGTISIPGAKTAIAITTITIIAVTTPGATAITTIIVAGTWRTAVSSPGCTIATAAIGRTISSSHATATATATSTTPHATRTHHTLANDHLSFFCSISLSTFFSQSFFLFRFHSLLAYSYSYFSSLHFFLFSSPFIVLISFSDIHLFSSPFFLFISLFLTISF